jgi:hypothetical protein
MVLILFSLGGSFLDLKRLYIYDLMLALAAPVGEWLYQTPPRLPGHLWNHGCGHLPGRAG